METLVLDSNYRPIRHVDHREIMSDLLCKKRVYSVVDYEGHTISTVRMTIPIPAVVAYLTGEESKKKGIRFSRENIWLRDRGKCGYCSAKCDRRSFTYDHVTPRRLGGKTNWENIVVACYECNQQKSGRTPKEAGMRLLVTPHKPDWLPPSQFSLVHEKGVPVEWKQFLRDFRYWNGDMNDSPES